MPPKREDERRQTKRRDPDWETLKRRVQLLAQLDGHVVRLRDGTDDVLAIAEVEKVIGVAGLLASIRKHGLVERAAFEKSVALGRPLLVVTKNLLATAHRDVRALATAPARSLAREHKKTLVRYGAIDEAWLKRKAERIEALSGLLRQPRSFSRETWFVGAVELMETLHGEPSAIAVAEAGVRLASLGAERRRLAVQRVEALASALESGMAPTDPDLVALGAQLERARDLPGRARRRLVHEILKKTMGWPELPKDVVAAVGEPLRDDTFADRVRVAGREGVRTMPAPRDPEIREKALEVLAFYGIAFRVDAGGVPIHSSEDIDKALAKKDFASDIASVGVTFAQGHTLVLLDLEKWLRVKAARWIRDGLELELLERAVKGGYRGGLSQLTTVRSARAFATWATKLVPHYQRLGVQFTLSAELFANLPKNEDLGVLALCLMHPVEYREARQGNAEAADPIATLDATLGLFKNLPRKAATVLDRLRGTTRGEGRRLYPDFAAWLDDDTLLDRMLHLARIGGEPTTLSQHLREDFEHESKAAREREHLERLPKLSERQRARLGALARVDQSKETFPRGRTRRRLQERIDALLPIAYRRELDAVFEEILREAWGITVPRLTPPWRDAVRFWLVVDDNRELLGKLLRAASNSPGRDVKLEFPENRAWQKAASFDIDAWLAPRREEVDCNKQRYVVTIEDDPLEVLRMGIPFGTCLALDTGCNAAATVLNALDLNKRVVYVRADGKVVARKLLAVTKEERLVGYRLYLSVGGEEARAITVAVDRLCRTIGEEAGLALSTSGEPSKIHGGFWYDDGTVGFGLDTDIDTFCRRLDLTPTPTWYGQLGEEARVAAAMDRGDPEGVAEGLRAHSTAPWRSEAGAWLVERLGVSAIVRRARDDERYTRVLFSTLGVTEAGLARALGHASTVTQNLVGDIVQTTLWCFAPSAPIARAFADAVARTVKVHGLDEQDYNLVARSTYLLARVVPNIADGLALVDVIAPAWDRLSKSKDYANFPNTYGIERTLVRLLEHWLEAPDPDAVVACLMGKRRSSWAQHIALGIAARHPLPDGARAIARLATLRPDLARSPRMLAAIVRQASVSRIDPSLEKRLFRTTEPPFEALGDLVTLEGWAELLDGYAPDNLYKWAPGPWEASYYRRHLEHAVFDRLFAMAKERRRMVTIGHEKLAAFGDVARLEALETIDVAPSREPPPTSKRWPSVEIAMLVARTVAAQVETTTRNKGAVTREAFAVTDVVDRAFADHCLARIEGGGASDDERQVLCDVFAHAKDFEPTTIVHTLALREADDVLARVLEGAKLALEMLSPRTMAILYSRGGDVRAKALRGIGPQAHMEHWAAYSWAVERAAAAGGLDVEGFLEDWALHLVSTSNHDEVPQTVTFNQFRSVARHVLEHATPLQAATFFQWVTDARSCAIYLGALRRLPRDRAAAIREAATKLELDGAEGAAKKAWLVETRTRSSSPDLRNSPRSPIDQA